MHEQKVYQKKIRLRRAARNLAFQIERESLTPRDEMRLIRTRLGAIKKKQRLGLQKIQVMGKRAEQSLWKMFNYLGS